MLKVILQQEVLRIDAKMFLEFTTLNEYLLQVKNLKERYEMRRKIIRVLIKKHEKMKKYLRSIFNLFVQDALVVSRERQNSI